MPNWCSTTYKCVGNKQEIRSLYMALQKINRHKKPKIRNGFGTLWLGELINELGYDWEQYRCRGEIIDFYLDSDTVLTINQETAWCEQEGVRECIEKRYPSITVYYLEEEPGCVVFNTNDRNGRYFPERYFLDSSEDSQYFETLDEAAKYVSDVTGKEVMADYEAIVKALDDYVEEQDDDDLFYSFHEITVGD